MLPLLSLLALALLPLLSLLALALLSLLSVLAGFSVLLTVLLAERIVEKLLLTPTEQLKALGDTETVGPYAEAMTRIFNLQTAAPPAPGENEPERPSGRVEPFTRSKARGPR